MLHNYYIIFVLPPFFTNQRDHCPTSCFLLAHKSEVCEFTGQIYLNKICNYCKFEIIVRLHSNRTQYITRIKAINDYLSYDQLTAFEASDLTLTQ